MFTITTVISLVIFYLPKCIKYLTLASKIDDRSGLIPLIGILPEMINCDLHGLFNMMIKYCSNTENIQKVWFGPQVVVLINSPDDTQKVLNSKECLDKPGFMKYFGIERASLFGTLDAWRVHRKVLNPGFSPVILKNFVPMFDERSRVLIKSFEAKINQEEFDVFPEMSAFFLDTILRAALDLDKDILNDSKKDEYVKGFDE